MNAFTRKLGLAGAGLLTLLAGCTAGQPAADSAPLIEAARSERQWTGVAVTPEGRIFVNFPRWSDEVPISVAELLPNGSLRPFPDEAWNRWEEGNDPASRFVCVQSVVADDDGFLWILDPANPRFRGVVPGGPKLLKADPETGRILLAVFFGPPAITPNSYLNDVRIDTARQIAYLTDSGNGALLVVDLASGTIRRLLDEHPSTHAEDVVLTIEGKPWKRPDGSVPKVHADGIALDREGGYVYYQALTGRNLYRLPIRLLLDETLPEEDLAAGVEHLGETGAADGLIFGPDGRVYLSAIEKNAVNAFTPGEGVERVVQSSQLAWPDSFALAPDGALLVTTSQIHRGPDPGQPYRLFRIELDTAGR